MSLHYYCFDAKNVFRPSRKIFRASLTHRKQYRFLVMLKACLLLLMMYSPIANAKFGINHFEASDTTIVAGEDVRLSWRVSGPSGDRLKVKLNGEVVPRRGSKVFTPNETTTYVLKAKKRKRSKKKVRRITVRVLPPAALIDDFSASNNNVMIGDNITLNWSTQHAVAVTLNGQNVDPSGSMDVTVDSEINTYTLTATSTEEAGETTVSEAITIIASLPAVINEFTPSTSNVIIGDNVTLNWSTQHAVAVTLNGQNVDLSGSMDVTVDSETNTYTLTAISADETTVSETIIIAASYETHLPTADRYHFLIDIQNPDSLIDHDGDGFIDAVDSQFYKDIVFNSVNYNDGFYHTTPFDGSAAVGSEVKATVAAGIEGPQLELRSESGGLDHLLSFALTPTEASYEIWVSEYDPVFILAAEVPESGFKFFSAYNGASSAFAVGGEAINENRIRIPHRNVVFNNVSEPLSLYDNGDDVDDLVPVVFVFSEETGIRLYLASTFDGDDQAETSDYISIDYTGNLRNDTMGIPSFDLYAKKMNIAAYAVMKNATVYGLSDYLTPEQVNDEINNFILYSRIFSSVNISVD